MNSVSTPYNRGLHRFALFTAAVTFLLILLGALVTSNGAGLSVPDWPTSFHRWPITLGYFEVPLVGGVQWEHTHRILAQLVGLLTIILALWTWRSDRRRWMRNLGWSALALVIAQGVLGGITVLFYLPRAVSTAHATLSQTFFCVVAAMAIFTGRRFVAPETTPRIPPLAKRPSLRTLTLISIAVVYVQLILGAAFRHIIGPRTFAEFLPHLIGAMVVALVLLWTIMRVLTDYFTVDQLRKPAIALLSLLMLQLGLGIFTYIAVLVWVGSGWLGITISVLHVGVGAMLLVHTVMLAIQAWRALPAAEQVAQPGIHKVVPA